MNQKLVLDLSRFFWISGRQQDLILFSWGIRRKHLSLFGIPSAQVAEWVMDLGECSQISITEAKTLKSSSFCLDSHPNPRFRYPPKSLHSMAGLVWQGSPQIQSMSPSQEFREKIPQVEFSHGVVVSGAVIWKSWWEVKFEYVEAQLKMKAAKAGRAGEAQPGEL